MNGERRAESGERSGFTILELLLAVTLMALIMVSVYGIVVTTVQAQERIEEATLGTELGPVILNQIRQDLEAAFVPDNTKDWFAGIDRQGTYGARDRLDFVAGVMGYGADSTESEAKFHSVNEFGYSADENKHRAGELVLYRREDPFIDEDPLKGGHLTELYDRVAAFDVTYFGEGVAVEASVGAPPAEEWQNSWSSKQKGKMPRAVKVEMVLLIPDKTAEGGVARRLYAITVALPR